MNQLRFPNQVKMQKGEYWFGEMKTIYYTYKLIFNGTWSKLLNVDIFILKSSYKIIEPKSSLVILFS